MARSIIVEALVVRGKKGRRSTFNMTGRVERDKTDRLEGVWDIHRLLADPDVDEIRLSVKRGL